MEFLHDQKMKKKEWVNSMAIEKLRLTAKKRRNEEREQRETEEKKVKDEEDRIERQRQRRLEAIEIKEARRIELEEARKRQREFMDRQHEAEKVRACHEVVT